MSKNLEERTTQTLHKFGMPILEHPIFYNCSVGIRFEIGASEKMWLKEETVATEEHIVNPIYLEEAFWRVRSICENIPGTFDVLRMDICMEETDMEQWIVCVSEMIGLSRPNEVTVCRSTIDNEDDFVERAVLLWDLEEQKWNRDELFQEILRADLGGNSQLVSSVFLFATKENILFHLYDDRGADLIAADVETIRPIYEKYKDWILEYDREKIASLFVLPWECPNSTGLL